MSDLIRNIIRFALFILVQVYLLNQLHLHQYIIPYIYYLFILWLPFSVSRINLLIIGFVTGLTLDAFSMQIGVHAAACTLLAYVRPFVINILTPKDSSEFNYREPSPRAMGWTPYLVYVLILTILHHFYMTFLQWLQFGNFLDFVIKVISTTGISMLLIITVELLFPRRMKFRTNTA
ncbi:MAG: rod shape-determining protein MreD [Chitinophagales bacterium]|nr:rod shape-determining protein MreD [Chitinophagales bacterium]